MDKSLVEFWRSSPEDPFDGIFEHAPILAHAIDAEGRLTKVSRAWASALGYERAEMLGRRSTDFLTEASRKYAHDVALPEFREKGTLRDVAYDFVCKDGARLPVRLSATSQFNADGSYLRSLAIMSDARETQAALEALQRKAEEAQEASDAKGRFLAAMSHEIRTPMNAIMGFAQLLDMSDLDDTRRSHVRAIMSAGESMMNLLTDLLDLSQMEAGHMKVEPRVFDLHDLLRGLGEWWGPAARDHGLAFDVIFDPDMPRWVMADPLRVQQVLNNYLGNAVKFTSEGGITLSVENQGGTKRAPVLRFRVTDTGPGIAAGDVKRLFKPFVQVHTNSARDRSGWGLGLSICRQIATAMGAEVGVTTLPDQGATFWLELPVTVETGRPDWGDSASVETSNAASELKILLAEDDPLNQDVLIAMLNAMGHTVITAENGFEALEAMDHEHFDLILMDVMMPGLDGIGAAQQVRQSGHRLPIVACTAHIGPEAEARYIAAGMDAVVSKPVDAATLSSTISRLTGVSRDQN